MNNPKVSIILPVYNGAKYLKQAVQSVLWQTFSNFELIAINDGSTDNSLEILNSFSDNRIKIINQENKGLISSLNIGIDISNGEYIARIDADDVWSDQDKLQKQVAYLSQNPQCVLVGSWAKLINSKGATTSKLSYPTTDKQIRSKILTKNYFVHPSVVFRKDAFIKAGCFNQDEKYLEDYGLWLRMGKIGLFANIPEYLMSYRIHGESVTRQKNLTQVKNSFEVIKKHKDSYPNYFRAYIKWKIKLIVVLLKNLS